MIADFAWIRPEPHGIHVVPADCWIDPSQPVAHALVTHGHADHARGGHGKVMATPETLAIMAVRYGEQPGAQAAQYGEALKIGDVEVSPRAPGIEGSNDTFRIELPANVRTLSDASRTAASSSSTPVGAMVTV